LAGFGFTWHQKVSFSHFSGHFTVLESVSILAQVYTFVFCLALSLMDCLEPPDLHAELLAVQSLVSALALAVKKLTGGRHPSPSMISRSQRRRQRRQVTLRKLYDASQRRPADMVDKEVQSPVNDPALQVVVEAPCADVAEAAEAVVSVPFPALLDLKALRLEVYDCSLAALRERLHVRLQSDAELLSVQLRSGVSHLHQLSADMQKLQDLGVLVSASALPDDQALHPITTESAAHVDDPTCASSSAVSHCFFAPVDVCSLVAVSLSAWISVKPFVTMVRFNYSYVQAWAFGMQFKPSNGGASSDMLDMCELRSEASSTLDSDDNADRWRPFLGSPLFPALVQPSGAMNASQPPQEGRQECKQQ